MSSVRLATQFNEFVEFDLLVWNKVIIVNLVDCCIRWTETTIVPSKDTNDVLGAIKRSWVGRWGPQSVLFPTWKELCRALRAGFG